jgi:hypothetical protein
MRRPAQRVINLGVVNGRRFAFAAGVGADAQAVRLVEDAGRPRGRRRGDAYFAAQIMRTLLRGDFREPQLEVCLNGRVVARGVSVFAANVHPWSFVGPVALKLAPLATFEGGLDVVVPNDMRRRHLPRYATQLLVTGSQARREQAARLPARRGRRARCDRPLPLPPTATISAMSETTWSRATPRGCSYNAAAAVHLDGALVVRVPWWAAVARAMRGSTEHPSVLAILHGVRSARLITPWLRTSTPNRATVLDAAEVDTEGLEAVWGARLWPRLPLTPGASSPRPSHARGGRCVPSTSRCRHDDAVTGGERQAEGFLPGAAQRRRSRRLRRMRDARPGSGGARSMRVIAIATTRALKADAAL